MRRRVVNIMQRSRMYDFSWDIRVIRPLRFVDNEVCSWR